MSKHNFASLGIVIQREFTQRVMRRSFIITTLVMPIVMVALMALPALLIIWSGPEERTLAVVDHSGVIAPELQNNYGTQLRIFDPTGDVDALENVEDIWGVLTIDSTVMTQPAARLRSHEAAPADLVRDLRSQIADIIQSRRLHQMGIDNLDAILAQAHADVNIDTQRIDLEESTDSSLAYAIAMVMVVILYMMVLLYGQQVMMSIVEEKSSRVLEVMVSSVKPYTLMMGKILGLGLVAVVQVLVWAVLILASVQWLLPGLILAGGADLAQTFGALTSVGYVLGLFGWLLLFMIGGYLFYAAMFAAVGSSVDDAQDAGQLTQIVMIPIILGIVVSMLVAHEPNSTLALWLSWLPFTSPMVMITRIPYDIPLWQTLTSVGILYLSFIGMVWLAAKIYRVGIFMHGRKPTVRDLWRWARYK